jgi:hypothetical protein
MAVGKHYINETIARHEFEQEVAMRPIFFVALSLAAATPAFAQGQPLGGRSERQVDELNRSMSQQIQTQQQNQNFQAQIDQLRSRQLQVPSSPGRRTGAGCPPGAIGC